MALRPVSIEMSAPPDVVFDFLTDPAKLNTWAGEMLQVHPRSDEPLAQGTTFRERVREGARVSEFDGEVVACERPRRFATRLRGPEYTMDLDLRIDGTGPGTHVEMRSTIAEAKPMARFIGALFGWLTQRTMARRLWLLKRAVEDSRDVT